MGPGGVPCGSSWRVKYEGRLHSSPRVRPSPGRGWQSVGHHGRADAAVGQNRVNTLWSHFSIFMSHRQIRNGTFTHALTSWFKRTLFLLRMHLVFETGASSDTCSISTQRKGNRSKWIHPLQIVRMVTLTPPFAVSREDSCSAPS